MKKWISRQRPCLRHPQHSENGDAGDDHPQFDQCKCAPRFCLTRIHGSVPSNDAPIGGICPAKFVFSNDEHFDGLGARRRFQARLINQRRSKTFTIRIIPCNMEIKRLSEADLWVPAQLGNFTGRHNQSPAVREPDSHAFSLFRQQFRAARPVPTRIGRLKKNHHVAAHAAME